MADAIVFHGEGLREAKVLEELAALKTFRDRERSAGKKAPLFVYFMKEPPHSGNQLDPSVI